MHFQCYGNATQYDAVVHFYDTLDTVGTRPGALLELPGYAGAHSCDAVDNK
jgi:hypothetical protein